MKHLYFILVTFFIIIGNVSSYAKKIEVSNAQTVAKNCYYEKINTGSVLAFKDIVITKIFTVSDDQSNPVYYIFNFNEKGFVIVSADDVAYPIISYSLEGAHSDIDQSDNFKVWMEQYKNEIVYARKTKATADNEITAQWEHYLSTPFIPINSVKGINAVTPLLTTTWAQGSPYNALYPSIGGGRSLAGCMPVVMASIMHYYKYPITGVGTHTHAANSAYSVNPGTTTYDWDNMPNSITSANTAINTILWHCAVTVNLVFSTTNATTTFNPSIAALKDHFKYPYVVMKEKSQYTTANWMALIKSNLDLKHPVGYSGEDPSYGGHIFVCDGYDDTDKFHFNFGWGGRDNGYFTLLSQTAGGYRFTANHRAVVNFYPNNPTYCTGQTNLTSDSGTFDDGSLATDYKNNADCSWLIAPSIIVNPNITINLTFSTFSTEATNDVVTVYNGETTTAPVLGTFSGTTLPPVIKSTGAKMLVKFTSNGTVTSGGWQASYTKVVPPFCNTTTDLTTSSGSFSDGSGASDYNNNTSCTWNIHPPNVKSIVLTFTTFNTQSSKDFVKVYNNAVTPASLLKTFSGTSLPATTTCPSGNMTVVFTSDATTIANGWSANYTSTVGIEDAELLSTLNIYPNPTENQLNISFNSTSSQSVDITLLSLTGQLILSDVINKFSGTYSKTIDLSSVAKGIYTLRIITEKGIINKKVVVE